MPCRCLTDFLEELGQAGEVVRVEAEVDPLLEIAEITARVRRADGPALLFPAVRGHEIPVLTNLLGRPCRVCRALGVADLGEVSRRIARVVEPAGPEGWLDRLRTFTPGMALGNVLPRQVKAAACQQIVRMASDVDLGRVAAAASHAARRRPCDRGRPGLYRRTRFASTSDRLLRLGSAGA